MSSATSETSWRWEQPPGGVWTLWFDQPGRTQNILDHAALDELDAQVKLIASDSSIKGLLIRSAKPAGFCAGADLKTIRACQTAADVESYARKGLAVFDQLSALAIPTVAVVHGVCLGGGLELALACQRRVGLASSVPLQIGTPEVQLGLIPGWGAITRLPRLIGPENALDLLITGRSLGYLQARTVGLVDRLAAEGDSLDDLRLMEPAPAPKATWSREIWDAAWTHARQKIDDQPGEFPETQFEILSIYAIDAAHGPEDAEKATVKAFCEMALTEDVKAALAAFFRPERADAHN